MAGAFLMVLGLLTTLFAFVAQPAAAAEAADIDQCRNGTFAAPVVCADAGWVNGNAGAQQAHFAEGEAMPFRLRFSDLVPDATNVVTIEWDYIHSDVHAYDYLVSYDFSEEDANPCTAELPAFDGCDPTVFSTALIPADPTLNDPEFSGTQEPGVFTLFEGDITSVSGYTQANGQNASNRITLSFTADVPDPVLAWGGHIGSRIDWGTGNSASAINGSPYHMRLIDLNGSGGNQDRSLSAAAVVIPSTITIVKDSQPDSAAAFPFTAAGTGISPTAFDLTDDGTPGGESITFGSLTDFTTNYTFTEGAAGSSALTAVTCTGATAQGSSATGDVVTRTATVNLEEGLDIVCTFVNTSEVPTIDVTKTADPTSLDEPGGDVTFTVDIDNTSATETVTIDTITDNIFDDLGDATNAAVSSNTCPALIGTTLAAGAGTSCTFVAAITGNAGDTHTDVVTVTAHDDENEQASDFDDATVTINDVAPVILVVKSPDPDTLPETGGDVTYTVEVTNTSNESVTITELSDDIFGNLDGEDADDGGDCHVGTLLAANGGTCSFDFVRTLAGQEPGTTHVNEVTAKVVDDDGTPAEASNEAEVTFTDIRPTITVDKSVTPDTLPETGGNATYTVVVTNTSPEPVTITSLEDDKFGTLAGDADCQVGTVLAASGGSCSFTFVEFLAQDEGTSHVNEAEACVEDNDNTEPVCADDDAEVTFTDVLPAVDITKSASCPETDPPDDGAGCEVIDGQVVVPEHTPTDVTFTFVVTNLSAEAATITSLSDTVFGGLAGDADCQVGTVLAPAGEAGDSCSFDLVVSLDENASDGPHHNIATACVTDDDENEPACDDDDETVEVDDVEPTLTVVKVADPTSVDEPGGEVTFTVTVTNTSIEPVEITSLEDSVFGVLAGNDDCQVGTVLAANGGSCQFSFTEEVLGNAGDTHTNIAEACVADDEENVVCAEEPEDVGFDDVQPSIVVTKAPRCVAAEEDLGNCVDDDAGDDTVSIFEPGNTVIFDVTVTNTSVEPVTITAANDILPDAGPVNLFLLGDCGDLEGAVLDPGETAACSFEMDLEGNAFDVQVDTVNVTAVDDEGNEVLADDDATVTFLDRPSALSVTKTADPTVVPEPGDDVTFTFVLSNPLTTVDPITILSIGDTVFGDVALLGDCGDLIGVTLQPGEDASCSFTTFLSGNGGDVHENIVVVLAEDDDVAPAAQVSAAGVTAAAVAAAVNADDLTKAVTTGVCPDFKGDDPPLCALDSAKVTFTDVPPVITIDKSTDVTSVVSGTPVVYNYDVSTPGIEELINVEVTDDKCAGVTFVGGDTDGDDRLDPGETWRFTCTATLTAPTTNIGTVCAEDDEGTEACDDDTVTVDVVEVAPQVIQRALPRTGSEAQRQLVLGLGIALMGVGLMLYDRSRRRHLAW